MVMARVRVRVRVKPRLRPYFSTEPKSAMRSPALVRVVIMVSSSPPSTHTAIDISLLSIGPS